jgi:hypothetical protein
LSQSLLCCPNPRFHVPFLHSKTIDQIRGVRTIKLTLFYSNIAPRNANTRPDALTLVGRIRSLFLARECEASSDHCIGPSLLGYNVTNK